MEFAMATALEATRFFPFLEPAEESALFNNAPVKTYERDQVVIEQNAPLRAVFLIEDGTVRVERKERDQMFPLAILSTGEIFGEMSFVDGAPTSARVVADEPARLRVIDEAMVEDLTKKDPTFAVRLYRSIAAILVERLRATSMHFSLDQMVW